MGVVSSSKPTGFHILAAPTAPRNSESSSRRRVSLRRASRVTFCFVFFSIFRSFWVVTLKREVNVREEVAAASIGREGARAVGIRVGASPSRQRTVSDRRRDATGGLRLPGVLVVCHPVQRSRRDLDPVGQVLLLPAAGGLVFEAHGDQRLGPVRVRPQVADVRAGLAAGLPDAEGRDVTVLARAELWP